MGAQFSDITLYTPTPFQVGTIEYTEETALKNYICDLYMQYMNGYKPPKATRICIQPAYFGIWDHTWKNGSIFSIAVPYQFEVYNELDLTGKYRYILDIIQEAVVQLAKEYHWDLTVFEQAYQSVIDAHFQFRFIYPAKQSRDRKKSSQLILEKTPHRTQLSLSIKEGEQESIIALFEKKNWWWYDRVYEMVRQGKWLDNDHFVVQGAKGAIQVHYSLITSRVTYLEDGQPVAELSFHHRHSFRF